MHHLLRTLLLIAPLTLLHTSATAQETAATKSEPITPKQTIHLLNGKDLSKFYTWLTDDRYEDPRGVFTIQDDGVLRISGDGFGGLITHKEYADYHLVMEYRWGTKTWRNRKDRARDSGLLLHCQGPEGNYGSGTKENPSPWMNSIECQVIEGGVGDILVLPGKDEDGNPLKAAVTVAVTRDRDGEPVWTKGAKKERFERGRINWYGRDPDWKDVVGFRGDEDVDSPGQEWTKLECFCAGDTLTYRVNGTIVNRATDVYPDHGKILLQTEGAELFVRKLELRPLPEELP